MEIEYLAARSLHLFVLLPYLFCKMLKKVKKEKEMNSLCISSMSLWEQMILIFLHRMNVHHVTLKLEKWYLFK
ncbi:hypothetical protein D3C75_1173210 [compost metagenome]